MCAVCSAYIVLNEDSVCMVNGTKGELSVIDIVEYSRCILALWAYLGALL